MKKLALLSSLILAAILFTACETVSAAPITSAMETTWAAPKDKMFTACLLALRKFNSRNSSYFTHGNVRLVIQSSDREAGLISVHESLIDEEQYTKLGCTMDLMISESGDNGSTVSIDAKYVQWWMDGYKPLKEDEARAEAKIFIDNVVAAIGSQIGAKPTAEKQGDPMPVYPATSNNPDIGR